MGSSPSKNAGETVLGGQNTYLSSLVKGGADQLCHGGKYSNLATYAESVFAKTKEELIRGIAEDVAGALGITKKEFARSEPIEKVVSILTSKIPSPERPFNKNFKSNSDAQVKLCRQLAQSINKRYGTTLVNLDGTPQEVCRQVGEITHSLFRGIQGEFLSVAGDVQRTIANLQTLRKYVDAANKRLVQIIRDSGDETSKLNADVVNNIYDRINSEISRQLAVLTNMTTTAVGPTATQLNAFLEENEDFKGIVADLRAQTGTDQFSDYLGQLLSGISTVAQTAHLVSGALKTLGMSVKDYKAADNMNELRVKIFGMIGARKPGSEELQKLMRAAEILLKADISHDEVVKELESGRVAGGDCGSAYGGDCGSAYGGDCGGAHISGGSHNSKHPSPRPLGNVGGHEGKYNDDDGDFGTEPKLEVKGGGCKCAEGCLCPDSECQCDSGCVCAPSVSGGRIKRVRFGGSCDSCGCGGTVSGGCCTSCGAAGGFAPATDRLVPNAERQGWRKAKRSITTQLDSQKKFRNILFDDFKKALDKHYVEIVRAVSPISRLIGNEIPITDDLNTFIRRFSAMESPNKTDLHIALTGYRRDIESRTEKQLYLGELMGVSQSLEPLRSNKHFAKVKECIDALIKLVDNFNDTYLKALTDVHVSAPSSVKGGKVLEKAPESTTSEGTPSYREDNIGDILAGGGDEVDPIGGMVNFMRDELRGEFGDHVEDRFIEIARVQKELKYYHYMANLRSQLAKASEEFKTYGEDYANVLGEHIGEYINKLTLEHNALMDMNVWEDRSKVGTSTYFNLSRSFVGELDTSTMAVGVRSGIADSASGSDYKTDVAVPAGALNTDAAFDSDRKKKNIIEAYRYIHKFQHEARVKLLEAAQALDLYMKNFTDAITSHPDDVKDIAKILDGVTIIAKWFTNKSGDNFAMLFENFSGDVKFIIPNGEHYYQQLTAKTLTQVGNPNKVRLVTDVTTAQDLFKNAEKAYRSAKMLDNIISTFALLGDKFGGAVKSGGASIAKGAFMSHAQIFTALTDYMVASTYAVGVEKDIKAKFEDRGMLSVTESYARDINTWVESTLGKAREVDMEYIARRLSEIKKIEDDLLTMEAFYDAKLTSANRETGKLARVFFTNLLKQIAENIPLRNAVPIGLNTVSAYPNAVWDLGTTITNPADRYKTSDEFKILLGAAMLKQSQELDKVRQLNSILQNQGAANALKTQLDATLSILPLGIDYGNLYDSKSGNLLKYGTAHPTAYINVRATAPSNPIYVALAAIEVERLKIHNFLGINVGGPGGSNGYLFRTGSTYVQPGCGARYDFNNLDTSTTFNSDIIIRNCNTRLETETANFYNVNIPIADEFNWMRWRADTAITQFVNTIAAGGAANVAATGPAAAVFIQNAIQAVFAVFAGIYTRGTISNKFIEIRAAVTTAATTTSTAAAVCAAADTEYKRITATSDNINMPTLSAILTPAGRIAGNIRETQTALIPIISILVGASPRTGSWVNAYNTYLHEIVNFEQKEQFNGKTAPQILNEVQIYQANSTKLITSYTAASVITGGSTRRVRGGYNSNIGLDTSLATADEKYLSKKSENTTECGVFVNETKYFRHLSRGVVAIRSINDGATVWQSQNGMANDFDYTDKVFQMMIKTIACKVFTVLGTYSLFNRPQYLTKPLTPVRLILGGAEKQVDIIDDAIELYIRLPLLAEWYREKFQFNMAGAAAVSSSSSAVEDNHIVSMIPQFDGIWSDFVRLVFVEADYVSAGMYTDSVARKLIHSINEVYLKMRKSHPKNTVMKTIESFVTEINRRYGVVKQDEIKRYLEEKDAPLSHNGKYTTDEFSPDLIDESNEFGRRPVPSDKFRTVQTKGDKLNPQVHIQMWELIKKFRTLMETDIDSVANAHTVNVRSHLNQYSFVENIKQLKDRLRLTSGPDEKFNIVKNAIWASDKFSAASNEKLVAFNEIIGFPQFVLKKVMTIVINFNYSAHALCAFLIEDRKTIENAHNANAASAAIQAAEAKISDAAYYTLLNTSVRLPPRYKEAIKKMPAGTTQVSTYEAKLFKLSTITKLSAELNGLIEVSVSDGGFPVINYNPLQELCATLLSQTKKHIDKFRSDFGKPFVTQYDIAMIELEDFYETLFNNRDSLGLPEFNESLSEIWKLRKYGNLSEMFATELYWPTTAYAGTRISRFTSGPPEFPFNLLPLLKSGFIPRTAEERALDADFQKGMSLMPLDELYRKKMALQASNLGKPEPNEIVTLAESNFPYNSRKGILIKYFLSIKYEDTKASKVKFHNQKYNFWNDDTKLDTELKRVYGLITFGTLPTLSTGTGHNETNSSTGNQAELDTYYRLYDAETNAIATRSVAAGTAAAMAAGAPASAGHPIYDAAVASSLAASEASYPSFANVNEFIAYMLEVQRKVKRLVSGKTQKIENDIKQIDALIKEMKKTTPMDQKERKELFAKYILMPGYYPMYSPSGVPTGQGLLIEFNNVLANYVSKFAEISHSNKIYIGLVESFANGAAAPGVMNGHAIPDTIADDTAKGTLSGDPQPGAILFATLARAINSVLVAVDAKNVKLFQYTNIAEVPSHVKEAMKANLPIFDKQFEMIARRAKLCKNMMSSYILERVAVAANVAIPEELKVHAGTLGTPLKTSEDYQTYLTSMCNNIIRHCDSIVRCSAVVQKELDDVPLFMETYENSIRDYREKYHSEPFMPASFLTVGYKSGMRTNFSLGDNEFKFIYGSRLILNKPTILPTLEYMPGVKSILSRYNSVSPPTSQLPGTAVQTIINTVVLVRFIADRHYIRTSAATSKVNIDNFLPNHENQSYDQAVKHYIQLIGHPGRVIDLKNDRAAARVLNIIDLNIVPINLHAMMREVPLIFLLNYSYTFDRIVLDRLDGDRTIIEDPEFKSISEEKMLAKCLVVPYGRRHWEEYWRYLRNILVGYIKTDMGRPKFNSDQMWGKVLLSNLNQGDPEGKRIMGPSSTSYVPHDAHANFAARFLPDNKTDRLYYDPSNNAVIPATPAPGAQYGSIELKSAGLRERFKRLGRVRYDSMPVRHAMWLAELQRFMRYSMRQELEWVESTTVTGHSVLDRRVTEFHRSEQYDKTVYE